MSDKLNRRQTIAAAFAAPVAAYAGSAIASPREAALAPHRLKNAGAFVDDLVSARKLAGAALRVTQHGEVLFEHCAGKADIASARDIAPDTIYRAYSMTKPVTAAAIMILVDDERLSLTDPVAKYVPEFADLKVFVSSNNDEFTTEPAKPMRIIDLLTHTSGLGNSWNASPIAPLYRKAGLVAAKYAYDPEFSEGLSEVARRLAKIPLHFQPGAQWLYSMAPDIAGLVVERAAGGFGKFLKERIFEPLGMSDTGFFVPEDKASRFASMYALKDGALVLAEAAEGSSFLTQPFAQSGAAGLVTTLGDFDRFASMLAGLGKANGVRILSKKSARSMMSAQVDPAILDEKFRRFMGFASGGSGAGMGMALGGAVLVDPAQSDQPGTRGEYTWGGAASTTFFAAPEIGLAATLMTQLFPSGTSPLRDMLKTAVYQAMD